MNSFLKGYWIVLLVGAFFALTSIYNAFGISDNVGWSIYIKTVRSSFIIALIAMHIKKLPNVLSILFAFGGIAVMLYLMLFRWLAACISGGDYSKYWDYMRSENYSLLFTVIIFVIFISCNYLNKK